jgi:hypothetical protein
MTTKADFTEEEWKTVLEAPPAAGLMVAAAQRGGSFRESFGIAKAYTEARKQHGDSALLDEIAATKPAMDHTRHHSLDELRAASLKHLTDAVAILETKANPDEVEQYKKFVVSLAERVAAAHREGFLGLSGERVSDAETAAINEIKTTLELPVDAA